MIARMRNGTVPTGKTPACPEFLLTREIPDERSLPGNLSAQVRDLSALEILYFVTLPSWVDISAVRVFEGRDETLAMYYSEDQDFLLDSESRIAYFEVVGEAR